MVEVPGVIHGLLGSHLVVHEVREQLDVALGLHRATHHAEGGPEFALPGSESGDDGVQGSLAGGEGVRVALDEAEGVTPVLEADAGHPPRRCRSRST